jgi:hypothetical protein
LVVAFARVDAVLVAGGGDAAHFARDKCESGCT